MFWGLIMEPNKRYSQLVERSFHLSMASLDVTSANDQTVQVMLCYENRNYLLCTLKKGSIYQVPLDLNFQEGTRIAFTCNGFGHVHLTGYLTLDEDLDFGDLEEEDEEEEEDEVPQLVKQKRKAVDSPQKEKKKAKREEVDDEDDSSDDDEDEIEAESDSEGDDSKLMMDDDDDDDDSDESEDDEDEEDSDEESEPEAEKPKQKQKQNQVGKKQDKQKMVNGKEAKQDLSKQKKNKSEQQQNAQQQQQQPKRRTIEGGVQIEDLKIGNGVPAKPGKNVSVYYVGRLKNGKKFDETRQGEGFKFKLGNGDVIKGWDVGISGMKIGGKRRLTIPAPMGYGQKGSPPVIPGNSTLIFEVELKNVH